MSGPVGVSAVILLEAAAGGAIVLWASGVWGAVRAAFFKLVGTLFAALAVGGWFAIRAGVRADAAAVASGATDDAFAHALAGGAGDRLLVAAGVFAALMVVWVVLLFVRQQAAARVVGLTAALAGLGALVVFGVARPDAPALAVAELVLGSLFLGSAVFGLALGHWYIVERGLSAAYMQRGAWLYAGGVAAAAVAAGLSARNPAPALGGGFSPILSVPGFSLLLALGLVAICALIAGFVWKLANEGGRSIQAATGYFYLALIMAFSAELSTKFRFF